MSNKYEEAIAYATSAHKGQKRKGTSKPYISHPTAVAQILRSIGANEEVIIAGLLHDTVEDTASTIEDIRHKFGDQVAKIVDSVTEVKAAGNTWKQRKDNYLKRLEQDDTPFEVFLVVGADKLHNLSTTHDEWLKIGDEVFNRFNAGKESQSWYYRSVTNLLTRKGVTDLANQINAILDEIGL
tara:strand:- start:749 stop:1297 length:549 start_codon:yes stop_codon:yes gene_type:complete